MAENSGNEMRLVRIEDLRHCLIAAFERLELPPEDAEQVAEVLLDSELRGHESHGVHLLGFLADAYGGGMNPRPRIRVLRESEGALLLEGDHSHVVGAVWAMRWCIERARERNSMALAGVRNSQLVVPGFYARMAAEAGLIGFVHCSLLVRRFKPHGATVLPRNSSTDLKPHMVEPFARTILSAHRASTSLAIAPSQIRGSCFSCVRR